MLSEYQNTNDLLTGVSNDELYTQLINQLNKDFSLANIDFSFTEDSSPQLLKDKLIKQITFLISNDSHSYQNLLYIIDVSEHDINKIASPNTNSYIENIVFLILKRILKKVWFKNKFSN
ncbi:hypothetical protein WH52_13915 [Tenacibaculum holothuriorum]|uniref:Uncharacterized protein n=1 Tax=Tenacibaculum holothuriorum TaxID=1635173 RepID=A0A1Y2PAD9_9FLAO|nr:hypothetical protein [Tenacibaculum holothuriorum]OSY86991.1 hypothetical protein WH52_13915 [Tenacibaculum holothuriorum]